MRKRPPYNPLDKMNLAKSIAETMLQQDISSFEEIEGLAGAGVYAIYYVGDFPSYDLLAAQNRDGLFNLPIYVGKAIPKGGRKGGLALDASKGVALRERLKTHAKSISEAGNLELNEFYFRSLVVDDIWIPLGENMLIEQFKPVWNLVLDGFGNKAPGGRRITQYRSMWDVLHPGRKSMERLPIKEGMTPSAMAERVVAHLQGRQIDFVTPVDDSECVNES